MLAFIQNTLRPRLSKADADRLKEAEGKWPGYLETLVELSDQYVPFPGPLGPKSMPDLPEDLRKQIAQLKPGQRNNLLKAEGKWPDFAVQLQLLARRSNKLSLPRDLVPARPGEFDQRTAGFIRNQLMTQLTSEERSELKNAEGHWPDYPRLVVRLASQHGLMVPGVLPGQRQYWDKYRSKPGGPAPAARALAP